MGGTLNTHQGAFVLKQTPKLNPGELEKGCNEQPGTIQELIATNKFLFWEPSSWVAFQEWSFSSQRKTTKPRRGPYSARSTIFDKLQRYMKHYISSLSIPYEFLFKRSSYLSKFDEKLNKFFVLAVIIVEIIQYRSSNQLMQKLQGENNQGFKN